jgi:hypothetical protein
MKFLKISGMLSMRKFALTVVLLYCFSAESQIVKIGSIDIYGNRNISSDTIFNRINLSSGARISEKDLVNRSLEKKVESIPGVKLAKTSLICCDKNGAYHLFIGIAESDSVILSLRNAPTLRITLPAKYTNAYKQFSERLGDAIQEKQADEDWSEGHSLIRYPPARRIQEKYKTWADEDFIMLSKVLRSSVYAVERATAAQILAYNFDKRKVVPELMYAIIDESDDVRNNAVRALAVIAYYASEHPEKNISIPYRPFIRFINSIIWSDRNKGLSVLMHLTKSRNEKLLAELRESSLAALKEMALWKSQSHAIPAFVILGRMAGLSEDEIFKLAGGSNYAEEAVKLTRSIE